MDPTLENKYLRRILLDAAAAEFAQELASIESVPVSSRFQRQMRSMVNNPNNGKKRRKCRFGHSLPGMRLLSF